MAMIEQLSPLLRAALRRRAVPFAGGGATLLLVLVFGLTPVWLDLTTDHGYTLIPGVFGVPVLLPGLRFTPLGDQSGLTVLCEDFAALLMVLVVTAVLGRHIRTYPNSGRLHRLRVGWGALVLAGFLAGFFRGLVVSRLVAGGPLAYFGYPALGAVSGAAWSLALGWIPGLAAVLAVGSGRMWWAVQYRIDPLWQPFRIRVYEPGLVSAKAAATKAGASVKEAVKKAGASARKAGGSAKEAAKKAGNRGAKEWQRWKDRRDQRERASQPSPGQSPASDAARGEKHEAAAVSTP